MKELNLPEPISAYFEADLRDGLTVAGCFTNDGQVTDEGQTYAGPAEIEAWKTAASTQFSYVTEPVSLEMTDRGYVVTSRVTGTFPGSPANLRFNFSLQGGKIASLEISP